MGYTDASEELLTSIDWIDSHTGNIKKYPSGSELTDTKWGGKRILN